MCSKPSSPASILITVIQVFLKICKYIIQTLYVLVKKSLWTIVMSKADAASDSRHGGEASHKPSDYVNNIEKRSELCNKTVSSFIVKIAKDAFVNSRGKCEYRSWTWDDSGVICPYCQCNHDFDLEDSVDDDDLCLIDDFYDGDDFDDDYGTDGDDDAHSQASGKSDDFHSTRRIVELSGDDDGKDDLTRQRKEQSEEKTKQQKKKKMLKKQRQKEKKRLQKKQEEQKLAALQPEKSAVQASASNSGSNSESNYDSNNNTKKKTDGQNKESGNEKNIGKNGKSNGKGGSSAKDVKKTRKQKGNSSDDDQDTSDSDENLLLTSAFAKKAIDKSGLKGNDFALPSTDERDEASVAEAKKQASDFAEKAGEYASQQQYTDAICTYTHAIAMFNDARFYGNRAFCYEKIHNYKKALEDADKCISLDPHYIKGHYRRAKALIALQMLSEARHSLQTILKLDSRMEEVRAELDSVMRMQLVEMGFTEPQSRHALRDHNTFDAALDALLNGKYVHVTSSNVDQSSSSEEESSSEESESESEGASQPPGARRRGGFSQPPHAVSTDDAKQNFVRTLWVGNILPTVQFKTLRELFSKYGQIHNIKHMPDKFCAFISYVSPQSAALAKDSLQAYALGGQKLYIKYPDNPKAEDVVAPRFPTQPQATPAAPAAPQQVQAVAGQQKQHRSLTGAAGSGAADTSRKQKVGNGFGVLAPTAKMQVGNGFGVPANAAKTKVAREHPPPQHTRSKLTGPVNGNECYFWRTTGCVFGRRCKHEHVEGNKGADYEPWMEHRRNKLTEGSQ